METPNTANSTEPSSRNGEQLQENNRMFESPPRAATNGPILMDDAMTPPPNQAQTPSHTPLSASRVTVATPGTVVQKTLVELDDLIHLRKMELSNLRAQNKVKYESSLSPRPRPQLSKTTTEGARVLSRARTMMPTHGSSFTFDNTNGSGSKAPNHHDASAHHPIIETVFESVGPDHIEVPRPSSKPTSKTGSPTKYDSPIKLTNFLDVDGETVTIPKATLEEHNAAYTKLVNLHEAEMKELMETQAKLSALEVEHASLVAQHSLEQDSVAERDKQIELLTQQLRTLSQEKNRIATQNRLLEDELASLKLELQLSVEQLKAARTLIDKLESGVSSLGDTINNSNNANIEDSMARLNVEFNVYLDLAEKLGMDVSDVTTAAASAEDNKESPRTNILNQVQLLEERFCQHFSSTTGSSANAISQEENGELYEKIAALEHDLAEEKQRFTAAAQSAFEWEAHSNALTTHFEGLLNDQAAKITSLEDELAAQKESAPMNSARSSDGNAKKRSRDEAEAEAGAVVTTAAGEEDGAAADADAAADAAAQTANELEAVYADRARIIQIAKTWMNACDKSWEHCELRRFFDALQMNYKFEVTKRVYKLKCKEFLIQERIRLQQELRNSIISDPREETSIMEALNSSRSDVDGSGPCCKMCGKPLNAPVVPPIAAAAPQQPSTNMTTLPAAAATGSATPGAVATVQDVALMTESLRSWSELKINVRRYTYSDQSTFWLLMAFFQITVWGILIFGAREYVRSIPGFMEAIRIHFGHQRLTS